MDIDEAIRLDTSDSKHGELFVKSLFNLCLWVFCMGASIIVISAIFQAGDGSLPLEPQWWVQARGSLLTFLANLISHI